MDESEKQEIRAEIECIESAICAFPWFTWETWRLICKREALLEVLGELPDEYVWTDVYHENRNTSPTKREYIDGLLSETTETPRYKPTSDVVC